MALRMPCSFAAGQTEEISTVPYARWDLDSLSKGGKSVLRPRFSAWLTDVDRFDSSLFGITAPEAELMDPQQRLLLEAAWEVTQVTPKALRQVSERISGTRIYHCTFLPYHAWQTVRRQSYLAEVYYFLEIHCKSLIQQSSASY